MQKIDEQNFVLHAAANYINEQCYDIEEFNEDLQRFKYIKRLLSRYKEYGDLRERLILNHIIVLFNVFHHEPLIRLLFFKLNGYESYLKTFLVFLNYMPERIHGVPDEHSVLCSDDINIDEYIQERLEDL